MLGVDEYKRREKCQESVIHLVGCVPGLLVHREAAFGFVVVNKKVPEQRQTRQPEAVISE